jgi:hypothetical protein
MGKNRHSHTFLGAKTIVIGNGFMPYGLSSFLSAIHAPLNDANPFRVAYQGTLQLLSLPRMFVEQIPHHNRSNVLSIISVITTEGDIVLRSDRERYYRPKIRSNSIGE